MPILYLEGAKRCRETELELFRGLLDGISDQMGLAELYKQANTLFTVLLRTMNNQLIMDLELDSENYLHIPYIPIAGVVNPFDLTADRLKILIRKVIHEIENKQFDDFYAGTVRIYRESAIKVDKYLCALGEHSSVQPRTKEEVHWFRPKGRSELYARLAMTIIRRIISGEFDGQKYLPSIPKLMEEYGVMKDTACRALAMLNSLGFTNTIDKKGSVITLNGVTSNKSDIHLDEPIIQERLKLFTDALQIVALTSRSCAGAFSSVLRSTAFLMEERLLNTQDRRISPLFFQLLMNSFIHLVPHHSLKNIFSQLEELILWGHYLQIVDPSYYPQPYNTAIAMNELLAALKEQNHTRIADAYGNAFLLIYQDVCTVLSKVPV